MYQFKLKKKYQYCRWLKKKILILSLANVIKESASHRIINFMMSKTNKFTEFNIKLLLELIRKQNIRQK